MRSCGFFDLNNQQRMSKYKQKQCLRMIEMFVCGRTESNSTTVFRHSERSSERNGAEKSLKRSNYFIYSYYTYALNLLSLTPHS